MKKRGGIVIPNGMLPLEHELATGRRLALLGYLVHFRKPVNLPGAKNPDVLLDGELWELKSPEGAIESIDKAGYRPKCVSVICVF